MILATQVCMQVVSSGQVFLVSREGILTAMKRDAIWILNKSPTQMTY
jgi:hypothetical protein